MQTLNVLQNDFPGAVASVGAALFLLATGIALIRSGALPRWLGWVGVVFGVLTLVLRLGPIGAGLWVLLASIVILLRANQAVAPLPFDGVRAHEAWPHFVAISSTTVIAPDRS